MSESLSVTFAYISAHVNLSSDASESNDGWVSIAGKAR
jgi:hypothetical protein